MVADAPVGFLLSGGPLDSSLVCAIAARESQKPIRTLAIGMEKDAIDLKYAKEVADYIGSEHTEVYMTREQVLSSLREVIGILGTFDITTIRASMGMYLLCRWTPSTYRPQSSSDRRNLRPACSATNTPTLRPVPRGISKRIGKTDKRTAHL